MPLKHEEFTAGRQGTYKIGTVGGGVEEFLTPTEAAQRWLEANKGRVDVINMRTEVEVTKVIVVYEERAG
jgi:hypothetical protein